MKELPLLPTPTLEAIRLRQSDSISDSKTEKKSFPTATFQSIWLKLRLWLKNWNNTTPISDYNSGFWTLSTPSPTLKVKKKSPLLPISPPALKPIRLRHQSWKNYNSFLLRLCILVLLFRMVLLILILQSSTTSVLLESPNTTAHTSYFYVGYVEKSFAPLNFSVCLYWVSKQYYYFLLFIFNC